MDALIDYSLIIWVLLVFVIIPVAVFLVVHIKNKWRRETEYYHDLAGYLETEYELFRDEHEDYSDDKAVRKFFSRKENLNKAIKIKQDIENEISRNKRKITREDLDKLKEEIQQKKVEEHLQREQDFFNPQRRYL